MIFSEDSQYLKLLGNTPVKSFPLTVSLLLKPASSQLDGAGIFGSTGLLGCHRSNASNLFVCGVKDSVGQTMDSSLCMLELTPDTWQQLLIVFDLTANFCYVNGQLHSSSTSQGSMAQSMVNQPFFIGQDGSQTVFRGQVSDVHLYDFAFHPNSGTR